MKNKTNREKALNFANTQNENSLQWIKELNDEDAFPTLKKMCKELDEELSSIQGINNT